MKTIKKGKIWFRSGIVAVCCFVVTAVLYFAGVFTVFENKTYDRRMVSASKYKQACDDISFIIVDQDSIDWATETYGWGWPWPREAYAKMIDFISAGEAKSIAFDILYTEPSIYGESDDEAFAKAEENSGIVILPVNEEVDYENNIKKVKYPVKTINERVALLGAVTSLKDDDDIIRRGRLDYEINGETFPTLGTAPLYLEGKKTLVDSVARQKDGSVLLRYQKSINEYFPYSAYDILKGYEVLAGNMDAEDEDVYTPDEFDGKYVFVAYYAPGLYDICSTPVNQVFPGVGVHITTLDNFLSDSFIRKVPAAIVYLWLLVISVFGAFVVAVSSVRHSQVTTVIYMVTGFVAGSFLAVGIPVILFRYGIWLELIAPSVAFVAAFLVCVALSFTVEGKQKRFIKTAFSQCLSKEVVNQILEDPESFTLGGNDFDMTAIFTDIQKFSGFSEFLTAGQLVALLNYYLTRMSDIIIEEGGTVDKYEGDAIVAFVGAPVKMEDHAQRACSAAIKMKAAEKVINEEIVKFAAGEKPEQMEQNLYDAIKLMVQKNRTIFTRIGLNSGNMIAGFMGAEEKKNYTMMGNNVNLASRLEGVNKQYHTNGILISEATRKAIGDRFIVRSLDRVRVVNVETPIRLYELVAEAADCDEKTIQYYKDWETAFAAFDKADYQSAYNKIKVLTELNPADNVARYYAELLENFFLKGKYPTVQDGVGVAFNSDDRVFELLQK